MSDLRPLWQQLGFSSEQDKADYEHKMFGTPAPAGEQAVGDEYVLPCEVDIRASDAAKGGVNFGKGVRISLLQNRMQDWYRSNIRLGDQLAEARAEIADLKHLLAARKLVVERWCMMRDELAIQVGEKDAEIKRLKSEIETGGERWEEHWQWVTDNFKARDTLIDTLVKALRTVKDICEVTEEDDKLQMSVQGYCNYALAAYDALKENHSADAAKEG